MGHAKILSSWWKERSLNEIQPLSWLSCRNKLERYIGSPYQTRQRQTEWSRRYAHRPHFPPAFPHIHFSSTTTFFLVGFLSPIVGQIVVIEFSSIYADLAIVFRALPFLNHSVWLSLNVCSSWTSNSLPPSAGCTFIVIGLPTANSVHMRSILSSGLILS